MTVTLEQLTKFYLFKQFLSPAAREKDVVTVAGALCGLHAQAALTPYLSLFNRIKNFESAMLEDALYREKSLVKTWCVRGTLHIIPSGDFSIYHNALERMWFEHHGRYMRPPEWPSKEERREFLYPMITEALAEKPLRRKEISSKVLSLFKNPPNSYKRLFSAWGGILKDTSYLGLAVHAEPIGNETCFARLDQWLPNIDLHEVDEDQARARLLLKYLQGYGPASAQDFMCWSGLLADEAKKAAGDIRSELAQVHVQPFEKNLWILKTDLKKLERIDAEEKTPPYLLPRFDPLLLGHKNRLRTIEPAFQKQVYRKAGDVAASVLINGRVAGTWNYKKTKRKITIFMNPFERIDKESLIDLKRLANDIGAFMKAEQVELFLDQVSM